MSKNDREELDVYVIPPNFIEGGKVFGGMFKLRNVIEAGLLGAAVTALVLKIPASAHSKDCCYVPYHIAGCYFRRNGN